MQARQSERRTKALGLGHSVHHEESGEDLSQIASRRHAIRLL